MPRASSSFINEMLIGVPPKEEQIQIAEYIEDNNRKTDKAITLQQKQITKLKEYKITLIDSVVTGKVRII
jgi:type I restriction enzyme S subunit